VRAAPSSLQLGLRPGAAVRFAAMTMAMTTAQVLFSIALGAIALLITAYAVYVAGSTMWGDRWFRKR
jgi:hypothetical protein